MSEVIETNDLQEAALRAILNRLQEIDKSAETRGQFASNIFMNQMYGQAVKPVFEHEIELISRALGIESPKSTAKEEAAAPANGQAREFQLDEL